VLPPVATTRPRAAVHRRRLLGIGASVAASATVIVVVLAIAVFNDGSTSSDHNPADLGSQTSNTVEYGPDTTVESSSDLTTTTVTTETTITTNATTSLTEPVDDTAVRAELDRQVAVDRPAAEALVGNWIPQLSAKRPGLVVNSTTFDLMGVLRDFRALQARYPEVLLLYSSDYSSFRFDDFWITVMPLPQPDGETANAWCDSQGIGLEDCYAKLISHTQGYEESTLLRSR
jgi:serine/threonine-protein kinase